MWTRIAALLCVLAACSTPSKAPPPAAPSPAVVAGTDIAWAQLTLALNERAFQILSLVPDRAADPRLVTLAAELTSSHTNENVQLNALLRRIGAPVENPHTGHDMPGMATAGEVASMSAARGVAFDQLFVESLGKHLTQCENLAQSMLQAGKLPDALALAAAIESARRQALTRLAARGAP
ncbi:MAG TPA: DUF305 domain-containing protein [Candidatus Limnocylindrales bacterium]|nr:DUF305 domain-containing protein [Candidatus Limnocylindrales bacterium]